MFRDYKMEVRIPSREYAGGSSISERAKGMVLDVMKGKVGFFWIVPGRDGKDTFLGEAIDLAQAERYGDALTHPMGHYRFWEAMKRRGPAFLRGRGVSGSILADEYEDWPRGRITYQTEKGNFEVFAHHSVFEPERRDLVFRKCGLHQETTTLRTDPHYQLPLALKF